MAQGFFRMLLARYAIPWGSSLARLILIVGYLASSSGFWLQHATGTLLLVRAGTFSNVGEFSTWLIVYQRTPWVFSGISGEARVFPTCFSVLISSVFSFGTGPLGFLVFLFVPWWGLYFMWCRDPCFSPLVELVFGDFFCSPWDTYPCLPVTVFPVALLVQLLVSQEVWGGSVALSVPLGVFSMFSGRERRCLWGLMFSGSTRLWLLVSSSVDRVVCSHLTHPPWMVCQFVFRDIRYFCYGIG